MTLKTLKRPSHLAQRNKRKLSQHELVFIDDGPLAAGHAQKSRRLQTDVFELIIGFDSRYLQSSWSSSSLSGIPDLSRYPEFIQILDHHKGACLQRLPTSTEEKIFRETEAVVLANDAFSHQRLDVASAQLFRVQASKNACRLLSRELFEAHVVGTTWAKRLGSSVRLQEPNDFANKCPRHVPSIFHHRPTNLRSTIKKIEHFLPKERDVWDWTDEDPIGIIDNRDLGSPYILLHIDERGAIYDHHNNPVGAAAEIDALWPLGVADVGPSNSAENKTTLRVRFLEGSPYLQSKVEQYARYWEQDTSIEFCFVESEESEIRVAFEKGGSWSVLGGKCLAVPPDQPTMNFGWFDEFTSDEEFSRTVLHEFGHALGLVHEHSSPAANISWNKEAVYASYAKEDPPWSKAKVDYNVFRKYDPSETYSTDFDPHSIMCYPVSKEETTDGYEVPGNNTVLSIEDKAFAPKCYPRQGPRTNLSGGSTSTPDCPTADSPLLQLEDWSSSLQRSLLEPLPAI